MMTLHDRIQLELLLGNIMGAVFFEDLADGETIAIHPDRIFPSASVIKVPIAIHILKLVETGELDLGDTVTIDMSLPQYQQPDGSGIIKNLSSTIALNIRDLLTLMLIASDNLATNELLALTTFDAINETLRQMNLEHTRVTANITDFELLRQKNSNPTTAREMNNIFKRLYHRDLPLGDVLYDILDQQKLNQRIPFLLPEDDDDLHIPHKTGTLNHFAHDVGLIASPEFCYTLAILTEHKTTWRNAYLTIARISELIYRYMLTKYDLPQY